MAGKDTLVEQRDPEELYGPLMQVVNRRRRNSATQNTPGAKGGLSKSRDGMASRYLVLVEEQGMAEGRLEMVGDDENQGLRMLGREKELSHNVLVLDVMLVTESHGVVMERSRSSLGGKEGIGLGLKKETMGSSSMVLHSKVR
ncbi:hypothetical protein V6N11_077420 [Hibiscus sabdariffa]|uniref:Uncharacterized protein n=1 Tax=Hibiscus sabdariffa TaxID=183260 RepID=A0ABR2TDX2_9ROSI